MRKFWLIALLSVLRIFPAAAYDITITAEKGWKFIRTKKGCGRRQRGRG